MNQAVKYVKELQLQGTDYLVQADGNQVYVQRTGGAYLCAKKDQRLLLVKRGTQGSASADGVYATLWPVTW